jgi:hypothetical protein
MELINDECNSELKNPAFKAELREENTLMIL